MKNLLLLTTIILFVGFNSLTNAQWFPQNNPSQNNSLNDIFVFDENHAIVVGYYGTILKTIDGGENWLTLPHDTTDWLGSVYFVNDNIGWIAGSGNEMGEGAIQKTTDGGNNWIGQLSNLGSNPYNFISVYFMDEIKGWAVGFQSGEGPGDGPPSGVAFKTTDGGINWIGRDLGINAGSWWSVFFINIDTGWVVGFGVFGGQRIAKTTDSGETWLEQFTGGNNGLFDVYFIDENIGWTVGYGGSIFKTTDGGINWISQSSGTSSDLYSVHFADENTGWAVGVNGTILNTTDGGINWINQLSGTSSNLHSVNFADENTGWAVGENGTILKTINGGNIPVELTSFIATIQPGYVELNWTTATELNNLGFEIQRSTVTSEFVTVGFVEGKGTTTEEHHYSFKDKDVSGFLRYRLKQVDFDGSYEYSGIIEVEVLGNISYELAQNYPNPFNPSTKITYSIPQKSFVTLKVFDPLGSIVSELVSEEKEAGKYEIDFNASDLSSGVYIYRLSANEVVLTRKMILLR